MFATVCMRVLTHARARGCAKQKQHDLMLAGHSANFIFPDKKKVFLAPV